MREQGEVEEELAEKRAELAALKTQHASVETLAAAIDGPLAAVVGGDTVGLAASAGLVAVAAAAVEELEKELRAIIAEKSKAPGAERWRILLAEKEEELALLKQTRDRRPETEDEDAAQGAAVYKVRTSFQQKKLRLNETVELEITDRGEATLLLEGGATRPLGNGFPFKFTHAVKIGLQVIVFLKDPNAVILKDLKDVHERMPLLTFWTEEQALKPENIAKIKNWVSSGFFIEIYEPIVPENSAAVSNSQTQTPAPVSTVGIETDPLVAPGTDTGVSVSVADKIAKLETDIARIKELIATYEERAQLTNEMAELDQRPQTKDNRPRIESLSVAAATSLKLEHVETEGEGINIRDLQWIDSDHAIGLELDPVDKRQIFKIYSVTKKDGKIFSTELDEKPYSSDALRAWMIIKSGDKIYLVTVRDKISKTFVQAQEIKSKASGLYFSHEGQPALTAEYENINSVEFINFRGKPALVFASAKADATITKYNYNILEFDNILESDFSAPATEPAHLTPLEEELVQPSQSLTPFWSEPHSWIEIGAETYLVSPNENAFILAKIEENTAGGGELTRIVTSTINFKDVEGIGVLQGEFSDAKVVMIGNEPHLSVMVMKTDSNESQLLLYGLKRDGDRWKLSSKIPIHQEVYEHAFTKHEVQNIEGGQSAFVRLADDDNGFSTLGAYALKEGKVIWQKREPIAVAGMAFYSANGRAHFIKSRVGRGLHLFLGLLKPGDSDQAPEVERVQQLVITDKDKVLRQEIINIAGEPHLIVRLKNRDNDSERNLYFKIFTPGTVPKGSGTGTVPSTSPAPHFDMQKFYDSLSSPAWKSIAAAPKQKTSTRGKVAITMRPDSWTLTGEYAGQKKLKVVRKDDGNLLVYLGVTGKVTAQKDIVTIPESALLNVKSETFEDGERVKVTITFDEAVRPQIEQILGGILFGVGWEIKFAPTGTGAGVPVPPAPSFVTQKQLVKWDGVRDQLITGTFNLKKGTGIHALIESGTGTQYSLSPVISDQIINVKYFNGTNQYIVLVHESVNVEVLPKEIKAINNTTSIHVLWINPSQLQTTPGGEMVFGIPVADPTGVSKAAVKFDTEEVPVAVTQKQLVKWDGVSDWEINDLFTLVKGSESNSLIMATTGSQFFIPGLRDEIIQVKEHNGKFYILVDQSVATEHFNESFPSISAPNQRFHVVWLKPSNLTPSPDGEIHFIFHLPPVQGGGEQKIQFDTEEVPVAAPSKSPVTSHLSPEAQARQAQLEEELPVLDDKIATLEKLLAHLLGTHSTSSGQADAGVPVLGVAPTEAVEGAVAENIIPLVEGEWRLKIDAEDLQIERFADGKWSNSKSIGIPDYRNVEVRAVGDSWLVFITTARGLFVWHMSLVRSDGITDMVPIEKYEDPIPAGGGPFTNSRVYQSDKDPNYFYWVAEQKGRDQVSSPELLLQTFKWVSAKNSLDGVGRTSDWRSGTPVKFLTAYGHEYIFNMSHEGLLKVARVTVSPALGIGDQMEEEDRFFDVGEANSEKIYGESVQLVRTGGQHQVALSVYDHQSQTTRFVLSNIIVYPNGGVGVPLGTGGKVQLFEDSPQLFGKWLMTKAEEKDGETILTAESIVDGTPKQVKFKWVEGAPNEFKFVPIPGTDAGVSVPGDSSTAAAAGAPAETQDTRHKSPDVAALEKRLTFLDRLLKLLKQGWALAGVVGAASTLIADARHESQVTSHLTHEKRIVRWDGKSEMEMGDVLVSSLSYDVVLTPLSDLSKTNIAFKYEEQGSVHFTRHLEYPSQYILQAKILKDEKRILVVVKGTGDQAEVRFDRNEKVEIGGDEYPVTYLTEQQALDPQYANIFDFKTVVQTQKANNHPLADILPDTKLEMKLYSDHTVQIVGEDFNATHRDDTYKLPDDVIHANIFYHDDKLHLLTFSKPFGPFKTTVAVYAPKVGGELGLAIDASWVTGSIQQYQVVNTRIVGAPHQLQYWLDRLNNQDMKTMRLQFDNPSTAQRSGNETIILPKQELTDVFQATASVDRKLVHWENGHVKVENDPLIGELRMTAIFSPQHNNIVLQLGGKSRGITQVGFHPSDLLTVLQAGLDPRTDGGRLPRIIVVISNDNRKPPATSDAYYSKIQFLNQEFHVEYIHESEALARHDELKDILDYIEPANTSHEPRTTGHENQVPPVSGLLSAVGIRQSVVGGLTGRLVAEEIRLIKQWLRLDTLFEKLRAKLASHEPRPPAGQAGATSHESPIPNDAAVSSAQPPLWNAGEFFERLPWPVDSRKSNVKNFSGEGKSAWGGAGPHMKYDPGYWTFSITYPIDLKGGGSTSGSVTVQGVRQESAGYSLIVNGKTVSNDENALLDVSYDSIEQTMIFTFDPSVESAVRDVFNGVPDPAGFNLKWKVQFSTREKVIAAKDRKLNQWHDGEGHFIHEYMGKKSYAVVSPNEKVVLFEDNKASAILTEIPSEFVVQIRWSEIAQKIVIVVKDRTDTSNKTIYETEMRINGKKYEITYIEDQEVVRVTDESIFEFEPLGTDPSAGLGTGSGPNAQSAATKTQLTQWKGERVQIGQDANAKPVYAVEDREENVLFGAEVDGVDLYFALLNADLDEVGVSNIIQTSFKIHDGRETFFVVVKDPILKNVIRNKTSTQSGKSFDVVPLTEAEALSPQYAGLFETETVRIKPIDNKYEVFEIGLMYGHPTMLNIAENPGRPGTINFYNHRGAGVESAAFHSFTGEFQVRGTDIIQAKVRDGIFYFVMKGNVNLDLLSKDATHVNDDGDRNKAVHAIYLTEEEALTNPQYEGLFELEPVSNEAAGRRPEDQVTSHQSPVTGEVAAIQSQMQEVAEKRDAVEAQIAALRDRATSHESRITNHIMDGASKNGMEPIWKSAKNQIVTDLFVPRLWVLINTLQSRITSRLK